MTLKHPISARHPIDFCVLVRPQFHTSLISRRNFIVLQTGLLYVLCVFSCLAQTSDASVTGHDGFVIDEYVCYKLDAVASARSKILAVI